MVGRRCLAFVGFAFVLAAPASGQGKKVHRDAKHGFAFSLADKWDAPVPIQPNEIYEIAKFSGPDSLEGKEGLVMRTELRVIRLEPVVTQPKTGSVPEGKGDEEGEGEDAPEPEGGISPERLKALRERMKARSFREWMKESSGYGGLVYKEKEGKEIVLPSKLKAHEYDFTAKTNFKTGARGYAAVVHMEGQDIGLVWVVLEKDFDKWLPKWRDVVRSFKPIEKEGGPAEAAALTGVDAKIASIKEKSPGRLVERTEHYLIVYEPDKKRWLPEIKRRIEAIRDRIEQDYPEDPAKPITAISVLRVCRNRDEYGEYGGPPSSAGYWSPGAEELVIFIDDPKNTWATMQHEAFHQYIFYRCGKLAPHSWYNEGTGDYYAGADFDERSGKFEVKKFLWRTDTIREAIREGKHVALDKIFRFTQPEYYSNGALHYAQGWSIVYFLREGKKKGARGWNPAWDRILSTYFDSLLEANARGDDDDKACKYAIDKALDGIDVPALEKAWMEFTS